MYDHPIWLSLISTDTQRTNTKKYAHTQRTTFVYFYSSIFTFSDDKEPTASAIGLQEHFAHDRFKKRSQSADRAYATHAAPLHDAKFSQGSREGSKVSCLADMCYGVGYSDCVTNLKYILVRFLVRALLWRLSVRHKQWPKRASFCPVKISL